MRDRRLLWASVDSPWLQHVSGPSYLESVHQMRTLGPGRILSSHLPAVERDLDRFFEMAATAQGLTPFTGPDQQALEEMLASFEPH